MNETQQGEIPVDFFVYLFSNRKISLGNQIKDSLVSEVRITVGAEKYSLIPLVGGT